MSIACQIIEYRRYSDRGAFMFEEVWRTFDVDEAELEEGAELPFWSMRYPPVVDFYDGKRLDLTYQGKSFSICVGDEVLIGEGIGPQEHGVDCMERTCIRLLDPNDEDYIDDDGRYDAWA